MKALNNHKSWMLELLTKFKPQSTSSKTVLEKESHFEASGKKAAVEAKLLPMVWQVSSHLVRQANQC